MVDRVKKWLAMGVDVRIFTARVSPQGSAPGFGPENRIAVVDAIGWWCFRHLGRELRITSTKDYEMAFLYDDRAVQIVKNTGEIVGGVDPFDPLYEQKRATRPERS